MSSRPLSKQEFITRSINLHGDRYDYSKVNYIDTHKKVIIVCKRHGEFSQLVKNHLRKKGCPMCSFEKRTLTTPEFILASKKVHGDKYNYSESKYTKNCNKISIICNIHKFKFFQTADNHLSGQGCPKCGLMSIITKNSSNTSEFIKKSKKVHGDLYDYSLSDYINNHLKVKIVCKKHGVFKQSPGSHLHGSGCGKCVSVISKPEMEFLDYCKVRKSNRQVFIRPYRIDGINRKNKTIYEFLGDYWHGNPKKFKQNDINERCKMTFGELYTRTILKFNNLKRMGYVINYVWESEWNGFKKNREDKIKISEF